MISDLLGGYTRGVRKSSDTNVVLSCGTSRFASTYSDVTLPAVGSYGKEYAAVLKELASSPERLPAFMCHYYNHYFAHTVRTSRKNVACFHVDWSRRGEGFVD